MKNFVLFVALFCSPPVVANDVGVAIGAGGIEFANSKNISIESEKLKISTKQVVVEYIFFNHSSKFIKKTIAFPLPKISFHPTGTEVPRFKNFRVWVDGKEKKTKIIVKATSQHGKDKSNYSELLKSFGLDPTDHDKSFDLLQKLPKSQKDKLLKLALVHIEDPGTQEIWPSWESEILYVWEQAFPPQKKLKVKHEYTPHNGTAAGTDYCLSEDWKQKACMDKGTEAAVRELYKQNLKDLKTGMQKYLSGCKWVNYVLTTGNYWKGPIKKFELILEKEPGSYLSLCIDGTVKKINPLTFQWKTNNFEPKNDLAVYFYGP